MRNKLLWLLIVIAAMFCGCRKESNGHVCSYNLCLFKGQLTFVGHSDCVVGSDCFYADKCHFEHPNWDYDMIDEYLFNTEKQRQ